MAHLISDLFAAHLRAGHIDVVVRVDVLEAGVVVATTDPLLVGVDLIVTGGDVQATRQGDVRRSFTAQLADVDGALVPLSGDDVLDPLAGREIRLWRGLRLPGGDELVPLITAGLERATVTDTAAGLTISLAGRDRAARIADNQWRTTFVADEGDLVTDTIRAIVADRIPNLAITYAIETSAETLPARLTFGADNGSNPWADLRRLAESLGREAFFDPMGALASRPFPNPASDPVVWSYRTDRDGLWIDPFTRDIDGTTVRNGVIVRGEAPWLLFPVSGEAWDTDPTSPTFYDPANPSASRVGPRPVEITDPLVGSDAQAAAVAAARLPDVLGVEEAITFAAVVNPMHDVGDVVELESAAIGGVDRFALETLTIPFGVEQGMSATTRRRRTR